MAFDPAIELQRLETIYKDEVKRGKLNALLVGESGVGKTTTLRTARLPLLVHSFDPGGLKSLEPWMPSGEVMAKDFSNILDPKATSWDNFAMEFERLFAAGAFDMVGTYAIDSLTFLQLAAQAKIGRQFNRPHLALEKQDWRPVWLMIANLIFRCMSLPCDFVLVGHISPETNPLDGVLKGRVAGTPAIQRDLPVMFDEIWYLKLDDVKGRQLLTQHDPVFITKTRIGGLQADGKVLFNKTEPPDIKALLKKAGYPCTDKPLWRKA